MAPAPPVITAMLSSSRPIGVPFGVVRGPGSGRAGSGRGRSGGSGGGKELVEVLVDLADVGRGDTEQSEVSEDVVDHSQLRFRCQCLLGLVVAHGEEHVLV